MNKCIIFFFGPDKKNRENQTRSVNTPLKPQRVVSAHSNRTGVF